MRAVYQSSNPYAQVGYCDVNTTVPVFSEERVGAKGVYFPAKIVGISVCFPSGKWSERTHFYHFRESAKHNQLTLTDPNEIYNMREWIRKRGTQEDCIIFKEVFCEDVPENLQGYIQCLKEEEPEQVPTEHKSRDTHNEDWDRAMEKRMSR